jgi:hypothetical protein
VGVTVIELPVCLDPMKDGSVDHTQEAPAPSEPPDTASFMDAPEQAGSVPVTVIPVGGIDAPGVVEQLRHCVPLQTPESHLTAVGVLQEPFRQVAWAVAYPLEQLGPAPHVVVLDLLVALQTELPVEQSVDPVWQAVLMPSVHDVPAVHALQAPVLSHTPLVVPMVHAVAMGSWLQMPVEHVWHVPQVDAQQIPEIQWPCVHWLSPEQTLPSPMVGVQAPPEPQ